MHLNSLKIAYDRMDFDSLAKISHILKSTSLNLGLNVIGAVCLEIETCSKKRDFSDMEFDFKIINMIDEWVYFKQIFIEKWKLKVPDDLENVSI